MTERRPSSDKAGGGVTIIAPLTAPCQFTAEAMWEERGHHEWNLGAGVHPRYYADRKGSDGSGLVAIQPISEKTYYAMKTRQCTTLLLVYGIPLQIGANVLVARTLSAQLREVAREHSTHLELILWAVSYDLKDGMQ